MSTSYSLPNADWLNSQPNPLFSTTAMQTSPADLESAMQGINTVLAETALGATITASVTGPQATRFELNLAPGVTLEELAQRKTRFAEKLNRFGAIRMLLPIPGRDRAGIEVPNRDRVFFPAETLFQDPVWQRTTGTLELLLGRDASQIYTLDLATGSHLLVAGCDGAGKSTLLRQLILSLISRKTPDELKLAFFENKGDTFKPFAGLPHLLAPQVKDVDAGTALLEWCLGETKRRRKLLAQAGVRSIADYRAIPNADALPEIILFVDEIAPLLTPKRMSRVHELLQGLDSAGNVGFHLVVATATIPDEELMGSFTFRVCGQCPQSALSVELLGEEGAEALLGQGDLLLKIGDAPIRCQSGLVSAALCEALTKQCTAQQPAKYDAELQKQLKDALELRKAQAEAELPPQLNFVEPTANDALRAVIAAKNATPAVVASALGVSSERAGNLLDELTFHEYLGSPDETATREIFWDKIPPEFLGKGVETRKTLETLLKELAKKIAEGDPNSRTVAEYNKGVHAIGKKIVEEAAEVWMAAEYEGPENTSLEISQLFYHLLVLMLKKQISLEDIYKQL